MRIIDPGHKFSLARLDGEGEEIITYVKRDGDNYPGNVGHYAGTNIQECWRAEISRIKYLNQQKPHWVNRVVIDNLRNNIELLEMRAAELHHRPLIILGLSIEDESPCLLCGHLGCQGGCKNGRQ